MNDKTKKIIAEKFLSGTLKKKKKNCKLCKKIVFDINLVDLTISYVNKYQGYSKH